MLFHFHVTSSLRHRRILTSVSNVCEEALMSLFWAPKDSTSYRKSVSDFLSSCLANRHWHGGYSNLGTQVRPALPNSNSIWNARTRLNEFIWTLKCFVGKKIYKLQKKAHKKKSIFLGTVVIKKIENEMVKGQGRERKKPAFSLAPPLSFPESTSHQPQKKKHTKKTGTYAGYSTPWSCVSLAINLTAYFSASLLFILRYLPSSQAFTVNYFRSVLETKRRRVHGEKWIRPS